MKTVKRKTILLVVAIALVLSLTTGLTLAYFSDYTEAEGGLTVALGGQTTVVEEQNDSSKVIKIQNTGDTDVIVRVAVYGPGEITFSGSGWTQSGDYWYYTSVLPAGEESYTTELTASWDVPSDLDDDYNVVVIQESEQAVYDASGKVVIPSGWADCINN